VERVRALRALRSLRFAIVLTAAWVVTATPGAQDRKTLDLILDTYVRDGFVYYRALKIDRAKLDSYVAQLGLIAPDKLSRDERLAFWLNAYNALVLRTVVDHYPIQARSKEYPPKSIRQIPGAFERLSHRVGGSSLTLDQIEQNILPDFHDPRVYLALGRGAVGGGRLRSEAFTPERLEAQLTEVANECATRPECIHIDRENNKVSVSAIFSWREKDFTSAYAGTVSSVFSNRSPIERAVIGLVGPKLLTIEKDFLDKNTFQLAYAPFDWTLNDLTGRGGR